MGKTPSTKNWSKRSSPTGRSSHQPIAANAPPWAQMLPWCRMIFSPMWRQGGAGLWHADDYMDQNFWDVLLWLVQWGFWMIILGKHGKTLFSHNSILSLHIDSWNRDDSHSWGFTSMCLGKQNIWADHFPLVIHAQWSYMIHRTLYIHLAWVGWHWHIVTKCGTSHTQSA